MSARFYEVLDAFTGGYESISTWLTSTPRGIWNYKPAPDKWSIHEVIVHLADCEAHFYVRIRHGIAEPGHPVSAFDQDAWTTILDYSQTDVDEALELFRVLRKSNATLLARIPPEWWHRAFEHPERGTLTVDAFTAYYVNHDQVHLRQMQRVFEACRQAPG